MAMTETVVAAKRWKNTAELIRDCWQLGYVKGHVYDMTPGDSGLWATQLPEAPEVEYWANFGRIDFRALGVLHEDSKFDTVFFDPPYKLNGTSRLEMDRRYGVDVRGTLAERRALIEDGFREALRICKPDGHVLVKCQDQVCSGRMQWQTDWLTDIARGLDKWRGDVEEIPIEPEPVAEKVDRFDMLGWALKQPMGPSKRYPRGRKQKHSHGRGSTLLVFRKL